MEYLKFPEPGDLKLSEPEHYVAKDRVLALYNQDNTGEEASNYSQRVKDWFISEAKNFGWSQITEVENKGLLLGVKVTIS